MWPFILLLCRTPSARDGNMLQQLPREVVKEKEPLCPSRVFVSFCGAEAILLTDSYGCVEPQRRPWTPTHLEKETKRRCIRHPHHPSPPCPPLNHPSSRTVYARVLHQGQTDRFFLFFSGVPASHKEAEAETFTTHLPPINPGLLLRTSSYWAPSIGICASICILFSSKRALSSWAVITLKKPPGLSS